MTRRVASGGLRIEPKHRRGRTCGVVRRGRRPKPRIDEGPVGEHPLGALLAVEVQHIAVKIDVAGEGNRYRLDRADARDELRRHDGAVFDAKARVPTGEFLLQLFVHTEYAIDGKFAVGVRRELKTREPCLARTVVQTLPRAELDAAEVGDPHVRFGEPSRAFRNRAVRVLLDAADAHHGIAESRVQAGGDVTDRGIAPPCGNTPDR